MKYCIKCGNTLQDNANFCDKCGTKADNIINNTEFNTYGGNITHDKLFCLSLYETDIYFKNDKDRQCTPTRYVLAKIYNLNRNLDWKNYAISEWWLRSSGEQSCYAASVNSNGSVPTNGKIVNNSIVMVHPAMWIKNNWF